MKTNIKQVIYLTLIIYLYIQTSIGFAQSYSLDDAEDVPFFRGTEVTNTRRSIVWDLNEIYDNRLDLFVGVYQIGYEGQTGYFYHHANWYRNQYDDNFNSEDVNLRIFYSEDPYENGISDLKFVNLNSSIYKSIIMLP